MDILWFYIWRFIKKWRFKKLLTLIDILVDGPFIEEKKDLTLTFRGSSNQRIIDVQNSIKSNQVILYNGY